MTWNPTPKHSTKFSSDKNQMSNVYALYFFPSKIWKLHNIVWIIYLLNSMWKSSGVLLGGHIGDLHLGERGRERASIFILYPTVLTSFSLFTGSHLWHLLKSRQPLSPSPFAVHKIWNCFRVLKHLRNIIV